MNARQAKKRYKKKYGVNPPGGITLRNAWNDFIELVKRTTECIIDILPRALDDVVEIAKALKKQKGE